MDIDFFDKETARARKRFNRTFGEMTVYDVKLRYAVLLAILQLNIIAKRIRKKDGKNISPIDLRKFTILCKTLDRVFTRLETTQRRQHHETGQNLLHAQTG